MRDKRIEPAAVDMAVLSAYGATMLTVPAFERNLAVLVLALEAKPWKTNPFKNKARFRTSLLMLISRQIDVFQRASAKALRNRLPQGFEGRDRLAPRSDRRAAERRRRTRSGGAGGSPARRETRDARHAHLRWSADQ